MARGERMTSAEARARRALARWYEERRTRYPWRERPSAYGTLVSEVMLQQTQASRVVPAYVRFLRRFPTVATLARALRADVLREWANLGYNRRAVALHEAARAVMRDHGGRIPSDPAILVRLPGVGPYTAAAVASLAFGAAVPALDTNVRRVVTRAALGVEEAPAREVGEAAARWLDPSDPATWNQAVMDLGRDVCRPRPRCAGCPLENVCRFRAARVQPARRPRRQQAFHGSSRQLRGSIVRSLRTARSMTLGSLARSAGHSVDRAAEAVRALEREGLVRAGPAARGGRPSGRVRLADH